MKKYLVIALFIFCALSNKNAHAKKIIDPLYASTSIIIGSKDGKDKNIATGFFFVDEKTKLYLITNKHVIYGEKFAKDGNPIIDKIRLNLHTDPNDLTKNKELTINLTEGKNKKWLKYKRNPEVDVVLIPVQIDRTKYFIVPLNKSLIKAGNIQVGFEKIYLMGYPLGWYDKINNLPITRVGFLSSPFKVPFMGKKVMLGDIEIHKGMSGSPVFMKLEDYIEIKGNQSIKRMGATKIILLGICSGQPLWETVDKKSGKKTQIRHTLVNIWFADLILEILQQE